MANSTEIANAVSSIHISTIKAQFVHPLLAYNFYIDNIPGVLNVHCESSELPSVKLDDIKIKFRGRELHYNGTIAQFTEWKIKVREDIYYRSRTALETWHNVMANNMMNFGAITPIIQRELDIYMLAPGTNIPVAQYKLYNAFPYDLGAITVDQNSNDQVVSYDVTFAFDAWERIDIGIPDFITESAPATSLGGS